MLLGDHDSGQGQAGTRESDGVAGYSAVNPTPAETVRETPSVAGSEDTWSAHQTETAPTDMPVNPSKTGTRWRLLAGASALVLTVLTIAAVYLLTKRPSTVDQLVILTVPSGAEVKLDSKGYGHSPVKLEQLSIGTYTLTITKEGFEPIVDQVTISESSPQPLEYKLRPVPPSESANLSPEEAIKQYQQQAEDAFAQGLYGMIYEGSALNYAELINNLDPSNAFAADMVERVHRAAHQSAQAAISRGDLARAQEIYNFLIDYYPKDEEARTAATKLESQLTARRGEVRGLVRKADEALQVGNLIEPKGASAYYYSNQALAINRQDADARRVRNQVKERLTAQSEHAFAHGDSEPAIKQLEQIMQLFPEDKQLRTRLREMTAARSTEAAKATDPNAHRVRGLELYRNQDYATAIPELQFAVLNGLGRPEVVFALARSYMKTGELDKAASYFRKVPESGDDSYRSSIAALGEISLQQGETASAVENFKEARRLGGSTLYTIASLDDKIERIERRERDKAAEPTPLTIQVRHLHGGLLGGSCAGPLTVNSTGVRYDGGGEQHVFSANLIGVGVRITKDEMTVQFQSNSQKFKVARSEAERFREALARFQQVYSPSSK
jgi:tetratricopeptide (TPR) repeat protein